MINLGFLTSYPKFILNINRKKLPLQKKCLVQKQQILINIVRLKYYIFVRTVHLETLRWLSRIFLTLTFKELDITAADKLLKFHTGNFQRWYVSLVCAFFPEERIFLIVFHDNCMHIICKTRKKRTSKRLLFFSRCVVFVHCIFPI